MEALSIIQPKHPQGEGWSRLPIPLGMPDMGYPIEAWQHQNQSLSVLSAVEVVHDPDDIDKRPEYHVSMSKMGKARCTRNEAKFALRAFGMTDAEEDNHVPNGVVRNYWMPVNKNLIGHECKCKDSEPEMREDGGDYVWRGIP